MNKRAITTCVFFVFLTLFCAFSFAYPVYDFSTTPSSLTTNISYYPVTGKVLSTTKTVYVNYGGVDHNTLFDTIALDYFLPVPLSQGTNNIAVKIVDTSGTTSTVTKQVVYDPNYSTAGREFIYANINYYSLDLNYHFGVIAIDTKKNSFAGIFIDKTIEGLTPDGTRMVLSGEWYSTTTNASTGLFVPNYGTNVFSTNKILFTTDNYAYYRNYKLNLATNIATQMGSFGGFANVASLSPDGSTIAYNNASNNQGFLNTVTNVTTPANFNQGNGTFFNNLEISPDQKYIFVTSAGGVVGGIARLQYDNITNYTTYNSCGDWPEDIKFSPDKSKVYIGCIGNSYYGAGGVEIIDLASSTIKGTYTLYGAGALGVTNDGRVYTSGIVSFNQHITGDVSTHGIYELSLNATGNGFTVNKAFFVNLVGNVTSQGSQTSRSYYSKGNIFVKDGAITCSSNSECGTNGQTGTPFCQSNNAYINYTTYTCNNPGTSSSSCTTSTVPQLKQTCSAGCVGGTCTVDMNGIKIVNGKVAVNGNEFLIKGLDYAPWLTGTGPDPNQHAPFPANRTDDVTAKVTSNGNINVTDYSKDGKIQAWEVIKYDVETMKKLGANTIRTYASGSWHDKDLDGVIDTSTNPNLSEIVQGDLPDWALDEILTDAQANNMKVIIGYWVQEEDFKETPQVVTWADLTVAKQAFGRVVTKYKSNPAVLGWGIGNEVNGSWNQGWFSWGVVPNDYLNALFAYTRTLDTTHPIIYAKYVGESTNFNTLTADIIAENAYISSASDLVTLGEFNISAPSGKAYMLGEFGHDLSQASDQWTLAQQYAGGAFLEYNDVWWKGTGYLFGVVDQYRARSITRYNALGALYGATITCSTNAQCNDNNTLTTDVCVNPATIASSCTHTPIAIPCSTNAQCNDNNALTTDICVNPGTITSSCTHTPIIIVCSTNTQCGTNGFFGTKSCSELNLLQAYRAYTCINPGTTSSSCKYADVTKVASTCLSTQICSNGACVTPVCKSEANCGTNGYVGARFCSGKSIQQLYRIYACANAATINASCSYKDTTKTLRTCELDQACTNGACVDPVCRGEANCGTNGYIGAKICSGKNIIQTYRTFACLNASTINAKCSYTDVNKTLSTC